MSDAEPIVDSPLSAGDVSLSATAVAVGGSRLNRFMKEAENVTGRTGEGEVVTPAEEAGNSIATADDAEPAEAAREDAAVAVGGPVRSSGSAATPGGAAGADPWRALVQVGAQFVAALAPANDARAPAHPWIERDRATGAQSLKMPLPPPETVRQLADALSALAEGLRGRSA